MEQSASHHTPSRFEAGAHHQSPTHQREAQSLECVFRQAFGENISQLNLGVNLHQSDALLRVSHMRSEPVVFDRLAL
jgi:hypothetical protein